MHRLRFPISLLLVTALAPACFLLRREIGRPEVRLVRLSVVRASLAEQELELDLLVRNPNDFEIDVRGLVVDLEVNGEPVAHGVSDEHVLLPAQGEARIPVSARTTLAVLLRQGLAARARGAGLDYRIAGHVRLGNGLVSRLPFEKRGTLGRD